MVRDILNIKLNENKLNSVKKVGSVMEEIRKAQPKNFDEWDTYYFENVRSKKELQSVGYELHEICQKEGIKKTLKECMNYIYDIVLIKTYNGFMNELKTKQIIEKEFGLELKETKGKVDSEYFVDYVNVKGTMFGIQVKPDTFLRGKYYNTIPFEERQKQFSEKYKMPVINIYYIKNSNGYFKIKDKEKLKIEIIKLLEGGKTDERK